MTDETQPNIKARFKEIVDATDPIIDKILLKVVASGYSPLFALGYTFICITFGAWVGHKP